MPVAAWIFDGDARDALGGLHGEVQGGAKIRNGRLVLDGTNSFVRTAPLERSLREKTLEAWVSLANLDQAGGGVLTVESQPATEPGEGIVSLEVTSESDLRDALCRALVKAELGVLEVSRLRDLETTFRALLGEAEGAKRKAKKDAANAKAEVEAAKAAAKAGAAKEGSS